MFCNIKKVLRFSLVITVVLFAMSSCIDKKTTIFIFPKPIEKKSDAIATWLSDEKNYYKKNYSTVFYKYYNSKIKQEDYEGAASILENVSTIFIRNFNYDPKLLATVNYFSKNYRNNISALNTTFLDSFIGNYYFDIGEYKKSATYFLDITSLEPDDYESCIAIARAYYDLSYVYFSLGKQNLSLTTNNKALEYYNKIDYIEGKGSVYLNYSNIYKALSNHKKAQEYNEKALKCYVSKKDTTNIYICLYNKIDLYEYSKNPKINILIDSIYTTYKKSNYKNEILMLSINLVYIKSLVAQNKMSEAKKMLELVKLIVIKSNSIEYTQEYYVILALFEINKDNKSKNINVIKKSIPILIKNQQYETLNNIYRVLKKYSFQNKEYKDALFYEEELHKTSDSLGNKNMKLKVVELDAKYQTEKKIQQIELQDVEIKNKNTAIALLISIFSAFVLAVIFLISYNKQKKLKLDKQNIQAYTKLLLEKTEEERKRIASDLHDSISHELLNLKSFFVENSLNTNKKIDSIINDIRSISRNLHPILFDKIGLKASIEEMVLRAEKVNNFIVTADISYSGTLSTANELQLYRIIQESLSNIIKYAEAIAAKITISETSKLLHVEIKDNGIGFNVSEILKNGKSLGLYNIVERSRAIGGLATIISNEKGTVIKIEIKKKVFNKN